MYVFDGTYEGLLSCVFEAYDKKERPDFLSSTPEIQLAFEQRMKHIVSDAPKAKRVETGFRKTAGEEALYTVSVAWLSDSPNKDTDVFYYICFGFSHGHKITQMLSHDAVFPVLSMRDHALREAEHLRGFVRFEKLKKNLYFSKISPKDSVIPLIMPHFVDRYADQPFVIYDQKHQLAGIYNGNQWELMEVDWNSDKPERSAEEKEWVELWKEFYHRIEIPERRNHKLKRSHCPRYFWENMPEML